MSIFPYKPPKWPFPECPKLSEEIEKEMEQLGQKIEKFDKQIALLEAEREPLSNRLYLELTPLKSEAYVKVLLAADMALPEWRRVQRCTGTFNENNVAYSRRTLKQHVIESVDPDGLIRTHQVGSKATSFWAFNGVEAFSLMKYKDYLHPDELARALKMLNDPSSD